MREENLLIELGTEELPPKALRTLADSLATNIEQGLTDAELTFNTVEWFAAPRRLAVRVTALAGQQRDKVVEKRGPAVAAAFDQQGEPTRAAQGWARANGIEVAQAERLVTDKGEWLMHRAQVSGQSLKALLGDLLNNALKKLPIPKPMRWGANPVQFIRPVHTLTMLYGSEVIRGTVLGLEAGKTIRGHRFHGRSEFQLDHADNYVDALKQHYVLVDYDARKAFIKDQLLRAADNAGAQVDIDDALLEEVTSLVEWPVVLTARFDESFLQVPKEALIYTMKDDQKYFPLLSKEGELLPQFLFITNIESKAPQTIIEGNEKVIRPRLADAQFFFETDKKHSLESRLDSLDSVLFQKQLGTLKEKSQRISALSADIAEMIGADPNHARRAGLLCKTDLMTEMVMEFPDVQGIMGMHYARVDGEHEDVALAMNEQYKPRFAGDSLPQSPVSCAVALADKLDSLVGIFGIGQTPKGDKDPFALRRAAIGLLRIIVDKGFKLDLTELVSRSAGLFDDKLTNADVQTQVVDFVLARFRPYYQDKGVDIDVIQAVEANRPTRPADFAARIEGVATFKALASAEALAAANKRVANILQKNKITGTGSINAELFESDIEHRLASHLEKVEAQVAPLLEQQAYGEALVRLASLRDDIDAFFDNVMVMADDIAVKNNRLALLAKLRQLFLHTADISLLNQ